MALGGALGSGLGARDAAAFCVAGVAQPYIHLRFTWQVWHNLTSTFVSRGRRSTHATPWRARVWFGRARRRGILRGRRGTILHPPSFRVAGVALMALRGALGSGLGARDAAAFCVAGVAQPYIHLRFTWQAWHNLTSTFVSRGRRGTLFDTPSFTHHFVTHHLSHTTLSHTIFHHTLFHTPLCHHTIFHTQLCHTLSLTHHLSHTTLSHTIFDTHNCFNFSILHHLLCLSFLLRPCYNLWRSLLEEVALWGYPVL